MVTRKVPDGAREPELEGLDGIIQHLFRAHADLGIQQLYSQFIGFIIGNEAGKNDLLLPPLLSVNLQVGRLKAFFRQQLVSIVPFFFVFTLRRIDEFILDIFIVGPEFVKHLLGCIPQTLETGRKLPFKINPEINYIINFF